jgi:hypothetical protein
MGFGDTEYDEALMSSWEDFCEDLKRAGRLLFKDTAPATPSERAEAFRYLAQSLSFAFEFGVEYDDPLFPNFFRPFGPSRKQAGDNPDAVNCRARIDGTHTYRIVGNRGTAPYVVFTLVGPPGGDMPEPWGRVRVGNVLHGRDLKTEWDGSFVITLSPDEHPGNWMRTTSDVHFVTVRQFFGNWEKEQPMSIRIERVGADPLDAPPLLRPEKMADTLRWAGQMVVNSVDYWPEGFPKWKQLEGKTNVYGPAAGSKASNPDGVNSICHWAVAPDEALIMELAPPPVYYWKFEIGNIWFQSMDYRFRLSTLNSHQAVLEEDGSLRVVIAHRDPGVPNWLDASGHSEGFVQLRCVLTDRGPEIACRLVKLADLPRLLPANARRIDADARREMLRRPVPTYRTRRRPRRRCGRSDRSAGSTLSARAGSRSARRTLGAGCRRRR